MQLNKKNLKAEQSRINYLIWEKLGFQAVPKIRFMKQ